MGIISSSPVHQRKNYLSDRCQQDYGWPRGLPVMHRERKQPYNCVFCPLFPPCVYIRWSNSVQCGLFRPGSKRYTRSTFAASTGTKQSGGLQAPTAYIPTRSSYGDFFLNNDDMAAAKEPHSYDQRPDRQQESDVASTNFGYTQEYNEVSERFSRCPILELFQIRDAVPRY